MALLKRTTTKSTGTPKKIEAPDPETYTEKGATNTAEKTQPLLGKCIKCKVMHSHSEVDHLCLACRKEAAGFEFSEEKLRWILREVPSRVRSKATKVVKFKHRKET